MRSFFSRRRFPIFHIGALCALAGVAFLISDSLAQPPTPNEPAPATAPSPPRSIADFRPSRDGFCFINSFTGSPVGGVLAPLGASITGGRFGLCGGMSAAAADFFLASTPRPARTTTPAPGDALYDYLRSRQNDSLVAAGVPLAMASAFAMWMAAPDDGPAGTRAMTVPELEHACAQLSAGKPVVLGLVLASTAHGSLFDNHQVLAYAWSSPAPDLVRIQIYDPNAPMNDDAHIDVQISIIAAAPPTLAGMSLFSPPAPILGAVATRHLPPTPIARGHADTPIRGFFVMPYAAHAPPPASEKTT